MKHRASPRFWRAYRGLPREVRQLADRNYQLLKANPAHPSLHFKKVGQFWSARVGLHYRALAELEVIREEQGSRTKRLSPNPPKTQDLVHAGDGNSGTIQVSHT